MVELTQLLEGMGESTVGEGTTAFRGGNTKYPECMSRRGQVAAGFEVGPLGSSAASEREIGCGLRRAVSVALPPPAIDESAIVLDIKGAVDARRVSAECGSQATTR